MGKGEFHYSQTGSPPPPKLWGGNLIEGWIFDPGMAFFKILWGGKSVWGRGKHFPHFMRGEFIIFANKKMLIYFICSYFSILSVFH